MKNKPAKKAVKPLSKKKAVELYKKAVVRNGLVDELFNKPKKKTGKFKSAMSGKFVKADAAKDNPYSTYKMKPSKNDRIVKEIKKVLKEKIFDSHKIIKINELVYKK